jgi:ubiquitin conjugation factor E4 B
MIALCVTFLRSTDYIKNPYLKSSLVSLLFSATWPLMHLKRGVLGDQLVGSQFANDHLLKGLMKFYIECESTGADSAFYDKFNIRYEIFQVIKCVWVNDHYKRQLTRESRCLMSNFTNMDKSLTSVQCQQTILCPVCKHVAKRRYICLGRGPF